MGTGVAFRRRIRTVGSAAGRPAWVHAGAIWPGATPVETRPRRRCPADAVSHVGRPARLLRPELLLDHSARAVYVGRRHAKGQLALGMLQRDLGLEGAGAGLVEGHLA